MYPESNTLPRQAPLARLAAGLVDFFAALDIMYIAKRLTGI
jgi:hypothetical protein